MAIKNNIGLVLPGGGARAAYQVGVLAAIADLLPEQTPTPFRIVCGTSAGAINAAALAAEAQRLRSGVSLLQETWGHLTVDRVYRTDSWTVYRSAAHWVLALLLGGLGPRNPRSLLDNRPLRRLLQTHIQWSQIGANIEAGHLNAVGITAAAYTTGRNVCFFQGRADIPPWQRVRWRGVPDRLTMHHIMASLAIPMLFPAVRLGGEFYGDGAMRQVAPLSHALHLGAEHLLVIGTRNDRPSYEPGAHDRPAYPSIGTIGGYVLDTLFMDSINVDIERLERLNQLIQASPEPPTESDGRVLRRVNLKVILPSQDLRVIAARHLDRFPGAVRRVLSGVGGAGGDSPLSSYLLFDGAFCQELMELGYNDAMSERDMLRLFLVD